MPATASFALPYPGALDEPCDFAQDWCVFTDAAGTVLDGFQAIVDRTYPVAPVAKLELNTTTVITSGTAVPFDSVTINNAGYIDFDANNSVIKLQRAGQFMAVFTATVQTSFVANSRFTVDWESAPASFSLSNELDLATTTIGFVSNARYNFAFLPHDVYVLLSSTTGNPVEIRKAALSVFWHSDRITP